MCGRFMLRTPLNVLVSQFGITSGMDLQLALRYNVAPTNSIPVVRQRGAARERMALSNCDPPRPYFCTIAARFIPHVLSALAAAASRSYFLTYRISTSTVSGIVQIRADRNAGISGIAGDLQTAFEIAG
jgi:SOS response associated peptidase (SRAP)